MANDTILVARMQLCDSPPIYRRSLSGVKHLSSVLTIVV
ncbi:hypothetical protein DICVIV_06600 [Dictyocaulus viviparus]|uniref:Uncharacterized protein n=1 Tax=Dictyocaulus viviparus TaxID=29172 RepID=A0A0D8XU76_DICVI|nr:hypothetical protein DICVIV_06600 [Dictyocaulus viviparus]